MPGGGGVGLGVSLDFDFASRISPRGRGGRVRLGVGGAACPGEGVDGVPGVEAGVPDES